MNPATASETLGRALEITEQMLAAARHGQWFAISELDARRQLLLRENFTPQPHDRPSLSLLLEKNDSLMRTASAAFGALEQELGQHNYNHRALSAYMSSCD